MDLKPSPPLPYGFLCIDKPKGISSHRAILPLKKIFHTKIGHTGTLDPFASGMLVVGIGEATKFCQYVLSAQKTYEAIIQLGACTDTDDKDGLVINRIKVPSLTLSQIQSVLRQHFLGEIEQRPPAYAALKYQGKAYYHYARKGIDIPIPTRKAHVLEYLAINYCHASQRISCTLRVGSGTYIRSIARDLGEMLTTCGHLVSLRRTTVANWSSESMIRLDDHSNTASLTPKLIPLASVLHDFPCIPISDEAYHDLKQGRMIHLPEPYHFTTSTALALKHANGQTIGLGIYDADRHAIKPKKIAQHLYP